MRTGEKTRSLERLIRPSIQGLHAYVPGEQPRIAGLIKLNTNENPYPPSPKVLRAIKASVDERLRLYPNPTAQGLRGRLGQLHGCSAARIIVGNGSDELLALATRAFVEPAAIGKTRSRSAAQTVQFFTPSYSLYSVLAAIHGAVVHAVPLDADFDLPSGRQWAGQNSWDPDAALSYVTTPNAPSGRAYTRTQLDRLCREHRGILILDEAYVDFGREHSLSLALKYPHVLVARTFSKAYSLCALRIGYLVGHPTLIEALDKVRDSYNVNALGQVAAETTLEDLAYYQRRFRQIIDTREKLSLALSARGFVVFPSQTNFLLVRPPRFSAERWLSQLRERRILVRWFEAPKVRDYLRITIGTDRDMNSFVKAVDAILKR